MSHNTNSSGRWGARWRNAVSNGTPPVDSERRTVRRMSSPPRLERRRFIATRDASLRASGLIARLSSLISSLVADKKSRSSGRGRTAYRATASAPRYRRRGGASPGAPSRGTVRGVPRTPHDAAGLRVALLLGSGSPEGAAQSDVELHALEHLVLREPISGWRRTDPTQSVDRPPASAARAASSPDARASTSSSIRNSPSRLRDPRPRR